MFCNRRFSRLGLRSLTRTLGASALLALLFISNPVSGQDFGFAAKPYPASPGLRPINHPSIPTGQVGALNTLRRSGGLQPVEWKLPEGVTVEVAQPGAFQSAADSPNLFGLQVGAVYRFKLSGVATYPGQNLYPTLEIIGKLNPPAGKEWDFPVEVEIPTRELALALRGNFVTRVIFVENSVNAASVDASKTNENLVYDVPETVDPVAAANLHGRALAILRIGSREPDAEPTLNDPFYFGLPQVVFHSAAIADAAETVQPLAVPQEIAAPTSEKPAEFQLDESATSDAATLDEVVKEIAKEAGAEAE